MAEEKVEKVAGEELTIKGVGSALGAASSRVALMLHWARYQRDQVEGKADWSAVHDTLEAVVFNLERAQALLHHEATVLLRQAGIEEGDESDA